MLLFQRTGGCESSGGEGSRRGTLQAGRPGAEASMQRPLGVFGRPPTPSARRLRRAPREKAGGHWEQGGGGRAGRTVICGRLARPQRLDALEQLRQAHAGLPLLAGICAGSGQSGNPDPQQAGDRSVGRGCDFHRHQHNTLALALSSHQGSPTLASASSTRRPHHHRPWTLPRSRTSWAREAAPSARTLCCRAGRGRSSSASRRAPAT